jgi:zinc/manganese transport system ATP-binding protein
MTPTSVELADVTVTYDRHPAIHHLSGRFAAGSLTAIVGPNGAGKSTLIKTVAGINKLTGGSLTRQGIGPGDVAYLPQLAAIDDNFPISVEDVVQLGHWRRAGAFRAIGPDLRAQGLAALAAVGLNGFEDRSFGSLSVGQRQRAMFARLLVADSPLILLDEPFTAIDTRTTSDLLRLVGRWHEEGRTVIVVLHDFDQVRRHFPHTLLLARRLIAWGPTAEVLTPGNLIAARAMSEAWETDADICSGAA